jgi:hypothetical protein
MAGSNYEKLVRAQLMAGRAAVCHQQATLRDPWPAPARLDELGVAYSDIVDASYGSGLSFRDPDNIALELFAPRA